MKSIRWFLLTMDSSSGGQYPRALGSPHDATLAEISDRLSILDSTILRRNGEY